jgi:hypothetical protein
MYVLVLYVCARMRNTGLTGEDYLITIGEKGTSYVAYEEKMEEAL